MSIKKKYAFCISEDINLGAAYIISYLKKEGHDVRLFFYPLQFKRGYANNSFLSRALSIENYNLRKIKKFQPDACCFSPVTASYAWAVKTAKTIKESIHCKIIFGGVHTSLVPEEVKKHSFIDEVIVGDGIKHFGGTFNPDELWPDREIFFKELPPIHRQYQLFMTSFGCPYSCSYCSNEELRRVFTGKLMRRTPEGCIKELRHLKDNGMKYVLFVDDIFTSDKKFLLKFLTLYKDIIGLPFTCFVHPRFVDQKVVAALKDAGCQMAWMGIQTGVEQLRKEILNRPESNDEIKTACALIKKAGIKLMIDHIFGIPFESEMTNDFSTVFYRELNPDIINCYNMLYFPKSRIILHAMRFGTLTTMDVPKIERGEALQYHTGERGNKFYNTYHRAMITIPLGSITWELLPTILTKLIAHVKAGRWWIIAVVVQNEIYFTVKALLKKARLM